MSRWLAVRVIALMLMANGLGGMLGVLVAWRISQGLVDELRSAGAVLPSEQARLAGSLRRVSGMVGAAAAATDGFTVSLEQAAAAVEEGGQSADELRTIFSRLALVSQFNPLDPRILGGLADPFAASAESFGRLSGSLAATSSAMADNSRDTARVASNLKQASGQIDDLASTLEAIRSRTALDQRLAELELGRGLLLALVLLQALLSALTGLALWLLAGPPEQPVSSGRPAAPAVQTPVEDSGSLRPDCR
jgi:hypothetical protein